MRCFECTIHPKKIFGYPCPELHHCLFYSFLYKQGLRGVGVYDSFLYLYRMDVAYNGLWSDRRIPDYPMQANKEADSIRKLSRREIPMLPMLFHLTGSKSIIPLSMLLFLLLLAKGISEP